MHCSRPDICAICSLVLRFASQAVSYGLPQPHLGRSLCPSSIRRQKIDNVSFSLAWLGHYHEDKLRHCLNQFGRYEFHLRPNCKKRSGDQKMTRAEGIFASAVGGAKSLVHSIGRGIAGGIAVVAMVVIYAVSSIGTYGVTALGLTGVTGLALATTAQPAQARRYRRRRRRRGRRWGRGWGPGFGIYIAPRRRRRRRRRW
jgi:hypothetical protein